MKILNELFYDFDNIDKIKKKLLNNLLIYLTLNKEYLNQLVSNMKVYELTN
jgi:hypothetical protein